MSYLIFGTRDLKRFDKRMHMVYSAVYSVVNECIIEYCINIIVIMDIVPYFGAGVSLIKRTH